MTLKPLKRHEALKPLSREHHHGLLLAWKIRSGLSKNIALERIKTYADWFYKNHLIPHFELEETEIFTILAPNHDLVQKALEDHKRIHHLFSKAADLDSALPAIEKAVNDHIRFEERILIPEIQNHATEAQMAHIEKIHQPEDFKDNLDDEFWK